MPTKEQVTLEVKRIIAKKAGIQPSSIQDNRKLTEWPLHLDSIALGYIAIDLRKYIQTYNSAETITAQEVRKSDLKVSALIDLVFKKTQNA